MAVIGPGATIGSGTISTTTSPYTVTVERGSSGTTAAAQSAGTISCFSRLAITSVAQLGGGIVEYTTLANHNMKTGIPAAAYNGTYPTIYFTDGKSWPNLGGGSSSPVMVTGPMSWAIDTRNGSNGATLGPSTAYPSASTFYVLNPASENYLISLPGAPGIPQEIGAQITGSFAGCNMHVNLPATGSDSLAYFVANKVLDNLPAGRKVYVELFDEFWNWGQPGIFVSGMFGQLLGYSDTVEWYVIRSGQLRTIFRTVFGSRANEIHMLLNAQFSSPGNGQEMLNLAIANGVTVDTYAVAPYIDPDNQTSVSPTAWNNSKTIQQMVDLWIHDLYYNTNGFTSAIAGHFSNLATYNANPISPNYNSTTGGTCFLYGYEGGYQHGAPASANNLTTLTHDLPYDPDWLIIEQDFYALLQKSGFVDFSIDEYCGYYFGSNNWSNYHGPYQQPGAPLSNRNWFCTPGFQIDYKGTAATNQDANTQAVRDKLFWTGWQRRRTRRGCSSCPIGLSIGKKGRVERVTVSRA